MGKIKKPFGDYNILINPFSAKLYKIDKKKADTQEVPSVRLYCEIFSPYLSLQEAEKNLPP